MRSPAEIGFRLRQEIANALLWAAPPSLGDVGFVSPLPSLPSPESLNGELRGSLWAADLIRLADHFLEGRIQLLGQDIETGPRPAWRRDWISGIETPPVFFRRIPYLDASRAGDHKNIWELSRHQHLVLLAQAYLLTGDLKYTGRIFDQLSHWWEENPFQCGINWCSALEVAFRALSWVWVFHLCGQAMTPVFRRRFLTELHRHALHLEYNLSLYFSPNTHLLGEAVALHAVSSLFPVLPGASRRAALARTILLRELDRQIQPDGSYFEQSTYYHLYALDMFLFHHRLQALPDTAPLRAMATFLASVVGPDGTLPFLGDDDGGRFFHPWGPRRRFARATLATCSRLFETEYLADAGEADIFEQAVWWLGPDSGHTSRKSFPALSRSFPDSGLVSLRDGSLRLLFDAGPFGPWSGGHSHSDTLSFVLQAGETEILIDPGTFTYVSDAGWRDRFRGSAAHNTIRVDGCDQANPAGPFRWLNKPETMLVSADEASAAGLCRYAGITHRRRVRLEQGVVIVEDLLEGSGVHEVEQFWHPGDGLGPGDWLRLDPSLSVSYEEGWRSDSLGSKRPASPVIVGRTRASFPLRLETRIYWQQVNRLGNGPF